MRTVPHGKRREQIVAEPFLLRLVRDGDIVPVLLRVELVEVESPQKVDCQQRAAEAAMLLFGVYLILVSFGKQVGIVYLAFLIDGDGGSYTTVRALLRAVEQSLKRILLHHHVRLYNNQRGIFGNGALLRHLQHQQIVGRRMVGQIREVHQIEPHLLRGLLQPGSIFGRAEIVVDGICVRHFDVRCHDGFGRL